MQKIGSFLASKAGSLVSKKLGAALGAESVVPAEWQGAPLIAYIFVQGGIDIAERVIAYLERRQSNNK